MTDQEMDIIDELHFVQSFSYLLETISLPEQELKRLLQSLAHKGWVKVLKTVDEEIPVADVGFENAYRDFFYLATKKGLLAFHSTGE